MNYPNPNPSSSKLFHKNGLIYALGISKLFGFGFGFFFSDKAYGPGPEMM